MHILKTIWHWVRWPLLVLVVAYAALVIYRIPAVGEKQKTADAIAAIQAQKVTMADVLGTNLPPQPYAPENDATVAGVDKNNNGIRDDVELAIFAKYPNSEKIRAAELQYAMAGQIQLTEVFNKETWVESARDVSRATSCIFDINRSDLKSAQPKIKEVQAMLLNTKIRIDARNKVYEFITSYGDDNRPVCDIDLNSLSN